MRKKNSRFQYPQYYHRQYPAMVPVMMPPPPIPSAPKKLLEIRDPETNEVINLDKKGTSPSKPPTTVETPAVAPLTPPHQIPLVEKKVLPITDVTPEERVMKGGVMFFSLSNRLICHKGT